MAEPLDEAARQQSLDAYRIVDSLPETAYDEIVELASMICNAPIALVSLLDRDRQWFKARKGFDPAQTRRDEAFCHHAIQAPEVLMEVPDAAIDPRFAGNPLVTGEDGVRFYAGMPLVTPCGAAIGTVCVLDREPRKLDEKQRAGLASLARLTMTFLENRHRERDLAVAAVLVQAEHETPVAESAPGADHLFSVAIFEVQDYAGAVQRSGERAIERALNQLDEVLEAGVRPGFGDSVARVAGSPELVVVLQGGDNSAALAGLIARLPEYERQAGLKVLHAHADSESGGETLQSVFERADQGLTHAKDSLCEGLVG